MSVRRYQFTAAFVATVLTLAGIALAAQKSALAPAAAVKSTVSSAAAAPVSAASFRMPSRGSAPSIPGDIPGGAQNASLTQAAVFAWQEFIAATWPAQPNGSNGFNRDVADPNGIYGATAASATGAPLVWETFRHKVEIFPGTTSPSDYTKNTPPHGATQGGGPTFGYNDPPQYNYGTMANLNTSGQGPAQYGPAVTGPCPGQAAGVSTSWVNADENSQIFLDTMYAGAAPLVGPPSTPTQQPSSQEILFLAKANHVHYQYTVNPATVGQTQLYQALWNHSFSNSGGSDNPNYNTAFNNFIKYQGSVLNGKQASLTAPYISFPAGTVEAKSAWRALTPAEAASGRFHMAMVRMYQVSPTQMYAAPANTQACWTQQPWGMLALHVIQKTPTAPYFIYATFSQADNIMNTSGQPIEDANGKIINTPNSPSSPSALDSGLNGPGQNPVAAKLATPSTSTAPSPPAAGFESYNVTNVQCQPGKRLYLVNSAGSFTPQGPMCVNARAHPIPQEIINVNTAAHGAIQTYNKAYNRGKPTPWLYYKLVNVQAKPMNKTPGVLYTGADAGTFYQSNDVVETNYNLQFFSGRLVSESGGVLMSDYVDASTSTQPATTPFMNVFNLQKPTGSPVTTYNMGGCMGCHGNAQQAGDDFSFIMNVGRNDAPEPLPPPSMSMAAQAQATANKVSKFRLPH